MEKSSIHPCPKECVWDQLEACGQSTLGECRLSAGENYCLTIWPPLCRVTKFNCVWVWCKEQPVGRTQWLGGRTLLPALGLSEEGLDQQGHTSSPHLLPPERRLPCFIQQSSQKVFHSPSTVSKAQPTTFLHTIILLLPQVVAPSLGVIFPVLQ